MDAVRPLLWKRIVKALITACAITAGFGIGAALGIWAICRLAGLPPILTTESAIKLALAFAAVVGVCGALNEGIK